MDEKLLRALSNIGDGLDELVKALQDKKGSKSDTASTIQAGDFSKQLKDIQTGLKSIKKDTQEILKQQKTILETAKKKEADKKTEPFETDPKKESMLKKGVGVIILIAVAVLAIGLAFKIVGKVDFFSVIALGIAIVLIAHAFEKIAATKLDLKQAAIASATMVLIAAGLMFSSFFLKGIKTIGLGQLITAVLIAAAMSLVLPSFAKMMKNLKGLSVFSMLKTIVLLPLILPAIALGIALASYALMLVKPISFGNFLGAIMVGAVFVVLSFGLKKIIKAFEGINPETAAVVAFTAPILFTGMSIAIWLSSKALSKVVPITFQNFVSAVMIAALFVVLAYAVKPIAKAISNMKWSDIPKIPVLFTILSLAIAASAFILFHAQKYIAGIDFMTMLKILVFTIVMGIAVVVLAFVSWLVNKLGGPSFYAKASLSILILATTILLTSKILSKGKYEHVPTFRWLFFSALNIVVYAVIAYVFNKMMTPGEFLKGSISILIMASTIMLTSQILSLGKYEKYPTLKWLIFTAVGILAFGVVAWVLTKLGGVSTYLKGAVVILVIAGVIMVTSHILNLGRYKSFPTLSWVIGVGAALLAFSVAAGILGLAVFGPQALIFAAGLAAILGVAGTIMATSLILAKGKYDMKGFVGWGLATAMLFAVFVPAIIALGAIGLAGKALSLLGVGDPIEIGKKALLGIASAIVGVSYILAKGTYKGGPTKAWAEGVGIAIGAFSPVYKMLMANGIMKIFGGGGVGPKEFSEAIGVVSDGIIAAAAKFAKSSAVFKKGPSKEWAEGVGLAIGAFAPVYTVLMKEKGLFGSGVGVKDMVKAIEAITVGIVTSAMIFNKYKAVFNKGYPTKEWSEGVGSAISAFSPVFSMLQGKKWFQSGKGMMKDMIGGVTGITTGIVTAAAILFKYQNYFKARIDPNFMKGLSTNVLQYALLMNNLTKLQGKQGMLDKLDEALGLDPISKAARGMVKIASAYDQLAKSIRNFGNSLNSISGEKAEILRRLTGNMAILSALDSRMFDSMLRTLERRASMFSSLLSADAEIKGKAGGGGETGVKKGAGSNLQVEKTGKYGNMQQQLDQVIDLLKLLNASTSQLDEFLAEQGFKDPAKAPPEIGMD